MLPRSGPVPHVFDSAGMVIGRADMAELYPAFEGGPEELRKTGEEWYEWSTCPRVLLNPTVEYRWPMNWTGKSETGDPVALKTPTKLMKGEHPLLRRLKECFTREGVFDNDAWVRFKSVTGNAAAARPRIQINVHVLNFAASTRGAALTADGNLREPIPLNLGAGGSLSHYCDQSGCDGGNHDIDGEGSADHVEPVGEHALNLDRQRCRGATLVVSDDNFILGVSLCQHAQDELSRCCRKVQVIQIPQIDADAIARAEGARAAKRPLEPPGASPAAPKFARQSGKTV